MQNPNESQTLLLPGIWLVSGHVLWVLFMFTQHVRTMIMWLY